LFLFLSLIKISCIGGTEIYEHDKIFFVCLSICQGKIVIQKRFEFVCQGRTTPEDIKD
jgi:hypothetical protein